MLGALLRILLPGQLDAINVDGSSWMTWSAEAAKNIAALHFLGFKRLLKFGVRRISVNYSGVERLEATRLRFGEKVSVVPYCVSSETRV